jgi:hypothetical protein
MSALSLLNYYTNRKENCKNEFHKFLDEDKTKRKSYEEVSKFHSDFWDKCKKYIIEYHLGDLNVPNTDYDEYISEAYTNYLKSLQRDRYRAENPDSNKITYVTPNERNRWGGNKKIITRRNKMKGRKSRKSRCNKNTKKRINKKKT